MSPIITPDTSEMEDLTPIDPGTYPARCVRVDVQNSKEKGTPMIVPTFKVTVGGKERTRRAYIVIAGPGSFNFDQLLRAVGEDAVADQVKANPGLPVDTDLFVNKEVQLVIESEVYQNQLRDRIRSYLRA